MYGRRLVRVYYHYFFNGDLGLGSFFVYGDGLLLVGLVVEDGSSHVFVRSFLRDLFRFFRKGYQYIFVSRLFMLEGGFPFLGLGLYLDLGVYFLRDSNLGLFRRVRYYGLSFYGDSYCVFLQASAYGVANYV